MTLPNETTTTPAPVSDAWYYSDGSQIHGPLSSRQLADLAARGCVRRDYPVKRGDDGKWHLASQVKGLIFAPELQTKTAIAPVIASPPPLPVRLDPATHAIDNQDSAVRAAGNVAAVAARSATDNSADPTFIGACPECGEQIKHAVKACPGCGYPLEPSIETAPSPVQPAWALAGRSLSDTHHSASPFDAATKQARAIVDDLRQMDLRGEIVPIDESNLFPLIHDEVFWSVALLGIVPLLIVTLAEIDVQVTTFALFFAAVWGVIFRSAILKHNASWKILLPSLLFTGLVGPAAAGKLEETLLPLLVHGYGTALLGFIMVVGVFEELAKFVPVACYLLWKRSAANAMTIILVGVFSGLGFAAFENLMKSQEVIAQLQHYVLEAPSGAAVTDARAAQVVAEGVKEAMVQTMLRPLSLVFCHAVWAGVFAYFLARASLSNRRWGALFIVGLCVSAFLHGTYDWFDFMQPSVAAIVAAASFMLFYAYIAKLRAAITKPDKPELVAEAVVPADA